VNDIRIYAFSLICFAAIFILERRYPLRKKIRPLKHLVINGLFTGILLLVAYLLVRPSIEGSFALVEEMSFGLISWLSLPGWAEAILAFCLLDLSFYYWHRVNHKITLLWRFHNIHHVDPELDVSTAFRFHFGEVAFSSGFRFLQIILIGPSLTVFLAYEAIFQIGTFFHHSNIRLPQKFESYLNMLIVTPRMHAIHHSQKKDETNSNFSVVFRIWDTLHRTLRLDTPAAQIRIGVPAYPEKDNKLGSLILLPFRSQRSYWHSESSRNELRDKVL